MPAAEGTSSSSLPYAPEGQTLLQRLDHWCAKQPSKRLFTFLDDHGKEVDSLTYQQAKDKAAAIAQGLSSLGPNGKPLASSKRKCAAALATLMSPGDRVLLVFLPSLDFIVAFLACLAAGLVPVPVFPPDPRRLKKDLYMFASIQASSGARVALTHAAYGHLKKVADIANLFRASKDAAAWPEALVWVPIEGLLSASFRASDAALAGQPDPAKPCFLQYTSGSTSAPKGVVITEGNLTHNLSIISRELETSPDTVEVSWLPQYHDMGLIGSYLGLLYCGGTGYYTSPVSFIRNPLLWPQMLSTYRGTHTQAPNFAYALTAKKYLAAPEPKPQLDLSSVRHMINAAEPVDGPALDAFCSVFGPLGLPTAGEGRSGVVLPTYGLAEHTVFVCGGGLQRLWVDKAVLEEKQKVSLLPAESPDGREIIGCGAPRYGVVVLVVDPETGEKLDEGRVGEIWVDSPSKAMGYFQHPVETRETFEARVVASSSSGSATEDELGRTYLRTGDLGFLYQKEIFVCGRIKDLIIVRGRNHYPQDIERTAERAAAELRPGCSAAFPVVCAGGAEGVALVAEVREATTSPQQCQAIAERVFQALSTEDGIVLQHIWLLKPRTVPKTTSGKIARKWCQKAFQESTLETIFMWQYGAASGSEENERAMMLAAEGGTALAGGEGGQAAAAAAAAASAPLPPLPDPPVERQFAAMPLGEITERVTILTRHALGGGGGDGRLWAPSEVDRTALAPLMALGMDSMASAQLKGALEAHFGTPIPDELFFQETTSIKRVAIMLYALGHGHLSPQDALEQYEMNHGQSYVFEIEGGGPGGKQGGNRFEWVIQTCPCWLCLPCCR